MNRKRPNARSAHPSGPSCWILLIHKHFRSTPPNTRTQVKFKAAATALGSLEILALCNQAPNATGAQRYGGFIHGRFRATEASLDVFVSHAIRPFRHRVDSACNITYVIRMAKGSSGRLVIVVDPGLKRELYVELARRGLTLKDWFIGQATTFLETSHQPSLFVGDDTNSQRRQVPRNLLTSVEDNNE